MEEILKSRMKCWPSICVNNCFFHRVYKSWRHFIVTVARHSRDLSSLETYKTNLFSTEICSKTLLDANILLRRNKVISIVEFTTSESKISKKATPNRHVSQTTGLDTNLAFRQPYTTKADQWPAPLPSIV